MAKTQADLEARIALLEAENRELRSRESARTAGGDEADASAGTGGRRKPGRWRSVVSGILVVLALLLTPVALLSSWARLELVDTDRFVATFAPLADDPDVQAFVADTVTGIIEEQVDIPELTSQVFDGIRSLDLPPRAADALGLLEGPAAQGLQALVAQTVSQVVASDAFADTWATALRVSHRQAIAAIQGDPNAALEIGPGGQLSVQLGPIIETVKQQLVDRGVGFASAIPVVDQSIAIAQADSLVLVQTVYALAVAVGTWLPWVVLAMLVGGVLLARNRPRAFVWTAAGFALVMATLAAGVGIGRLFFVGTVSPSIMPAGAAGALYEQIIELIRSTIVAGLVLGLLTAIIAWWAGPFRPARALRGFSNAMFASVRRQAAKHGVTTGAFGVALDRFRSAVYLGIALIAVLVVLFGRPLTTGLVVTTVLLALLAILLVELLRRPAEERPDAPPADGEADGEADEGPDASATGRPVEVKGNAAADHAAATARGRE
ncbi:hypothetical protein ACFOE1_13045 [Agromyces mediolanus]|uniref:Integral membrane protein n=1 Tax=Agromyces mediolanus TaxID=41986 RepID=A0A918F8K1_AGRME|nr:hypothetical protein [Agromyces mediolanus]GGR15780.1 hypothetical protein GCM10010196_05630 [Agromyces mediolanus]GLJ73546.1 hypothetical protein GCM10017583_28050 [Agromyces mediolanus]